MKTDSKVVETSVLCMLFLVSLVVTPGLNFDSIMLPKFIVLVTVGFSLLVFNLLSSAKNHFKRIRWIYVIFILATIPSFLFSNLSFVDQLYGDQSRYAGFLTQVSYLSIFLGVIVIANEDFIARALKLFVVVSSLNVLYASVQFFSFDPVSWRSSAIGMSSFQGNPNFYSSMSGILCIVLIYKAWFPRYSSRIFFQNVFFVFFICFLNFKSESIQGLFLTYFGLVLMIVLKSLQKYGKRITFIFSSLNLVVFLFVSISVWGVGPLGDKVSQQSLFERRDFWLAGIRMFFSNPIGGVGLDGYGDWFHRMRTPSSSMPVGSRSWTNSPHSQIIEYFSFGGVFLGCSYILMVSWLVILAIKSLRESKNSNTKALAAIVFMALVIQAQISMHSVVLNSWMWFMAGALVGLNRNAVNHEKSLNRRVAKNESRLQSGQFTMIPTLILVGSMLGFGLVAPLLASDYNFSKALRQGDSRQIFQAANSIFLHDQYALVAASIFASSSQRENALLLLDQVHSRNPDNVIVLYLIRDLITDKADGAMLLQSKIHELDPYGPYAVPENR